MTDQPTNQGDFDPTGTIAAAWANEGIGASSFARFLPPDPGAIADSVSRAHRKDQRRLLHLNVREFLPAVIVSVVFLSDASDAARPAAVIAAAIIAMGASLYLAFNSLRHHRADQAWAGSVRQQLARRMEQLNHRATLLHSVGRWYFPPFAVAIGLYYWGTGGGVPTTDDIGFIAMWIGIFVAGYALNRWVARTQYEPEAARYRTLLAEFDRAA